MTLGKGPLVQGSLGTTLPRLHFRPGLVKSFILGSVSHTIFQGFQGSGLCMGWCRGV